MPVTEADICNMALSRIGVSTRIATLDDATAQAEVCKLFYAHARDELLEAAAWPFATRRATLAELADEERDGWGYTYALPTDCIAPRYIWSGVRATRRDEEVAFAIEDDGDGAKRILLTDHDAPVLVYTARIENTGAFPTLFVDALAWRLASHLALPLSVKQDLEERALVRYRMAEARGLAAAYHQSPGDPEPDAEHIAVR